MRASAKTIRVSEISAVSFRRVALVVAVCFAALIVTHLPLLRLPYFWDEAGYYIPAARDIFYAHSLIPHSTPSNAHPPLVMLWIAAAWKIFGNTLLVSRCAMLLIAAFGLAGTFELAGAVASRATAIATVCCVAAYPVFFAQASLAQVDMPAATLTVWALVFYLRRRWGWSAFWFVLAGLAKETAVIAPLALLAWEVVAPEGWLSSSTPTELRTGTRDERARWWLLTPAVILVGWFAYHFAETGYVFGNPEFFRYNVAGTMHPVRIGFAFVRRGWQLFGYMGMYALTLAALLAMMLTPQREGDGSERLRIAIPVELTFAVVAGSYWIALSFIGGAPLARYMLPAVLLVILLCINTLRRRVPAWPALAALIVAVMAASLFINPPYSFAPEDNLAYRDFVILHQRAAQFLESTQRRPPLLEGQGLRVLTAWPATNELELPWEGYVQSPIPTVAIEDFTPQNLITARQRGGFDYALVFSTKYYPPHPLPMPKFWQRAQSEYFGFHRDATPAEAAQILGGEMIFQEYRGGQWAAVIEMPVIRNAALRAPQ